MTRKQRQRIERAAAVTICQSARANVDYEAEADAFKQLQAVRRWRGDPPDSAEPAGVPGLK
jgi:hypothetical protein